jgi:hypothetical protein
VVTCNEFWIKHLPIFLWLEMPWLPCFFFFHTNTKYFKISK